MPKLNVQQHLQLCESITNGWRLLLRRRRPLLADTSGGLNESCVRLLENSGVMTDERGRAAEAMLHVRVI